MFEIFHTISQFLGWQQFIMWLKFVICILFLCLSIISYLIILYLHICMMSSHRHIVPNRIISLRLYIFVHIEVSYHGSFARRGPTYRGGLPRVDNRERGSAATWRSPCPPPETSGVIFSDFQLVFFAKFCHIVRFRIVILSGIWVSNFQIDFIGST